MLKWLGLVKWSNTSNNSEVFGVWEALDDAWWIYWSNFVPLISVDMNWCSNVAYVMPWQEEIGLALPGLPVLLGDVETDSRGMNIVCWRPGMMGGVHWLTCIISIAAMSTGSCMYITVLYNVIFCPPVPCAARRIPESVQKWRYHPEVPRSTLEKYD